MKGIIASVVIFSAALAGQAAERWVPATVTVYGSDPDSGGEWFLDDISRYTYDRDGNQLVNVTTGGNGVVTRETKTYDSNGRYLTKLGESQSGTRWVAYERAQRQFDERTGLEIMVRNVNIAPNGTESPGNSFNRVITRDELGRITGVEIQVLFNGNYDPTERLTVTYGDNGLPVELRQLARNSRGTWETGAVYTDITWQDCDCQVASVEGLFTGKNRIKSAHFVQRNGTRPYYDYDITATYQEGKADYDVEFTGMIQGYDRSGQRIEVRYTDRNGSSRMRTEYYSLKADSDEKEFSEYYINEVQYDAWGNDVLVQQLSYTSENPTRTLEMRQQANVVYDETYGYPLSMEVTDYDAETRTDKPMLKVEFADYLDASSLPESAIDQIAAPSAAGEWFGIDGRRVARPGRGVFIHKQGNKVTKVLK